MLRIAGVELDIFNLELFFCGGVNGGGGVEGEEKGWGGGKGEGRRMVGGSWQRVASHCSPATGAG